MKNIRQAATPAATAAIHGVSCEVNGSADIAGSPKPVRVIAPARIHFGMLRFGVTHQRQFGGAGVMISAPAVEVRARPSSTLQVIAADRARAEACVRRWSAHRHAGAEPKCTLEIAGKIYPHVGLGSGTQLALAIAAALDRFHGHPTKDPLELAVATSRAQRSAVGTYGFWQGGFVAELGRTDREPIAPLHQRLEMPAAWRVVLIRPLGAMGLAGNAELEAFGRLPSVPMGVADTLECELIDRMIPALKRQDFNDFSESVYRYGHLAGSCFAARQGGPFASATIERVVEKCRRLGFLGTGQSSWGPTVFTLAESQKSAVRLQRLLQQSYATNEFEMTISTFNNRGAEISCGGALAPQTTVD